MDRGRSPLHFAAWEGRGSLVEQLLVARAAVDAPEHQGALGATFTLNQFLFS